MDEQDKGKSASVTKKKQEVGKKRIEDPKGTGIVKDERFLLHCCPFGSEHGKSECPERLTKIHKKLKDYGLLDRCVQVQARLASNEELLFCHSQDYVNKMRSTATMALDQIQELSNTYDSIFICKDTFVTACLAAGSLIGLTAKVVSGELKNGIAIVRPPGHHAQESIANGYCIFNNVAIAARFAKEKFNLERILIVDFDVHHGQGIQYLFEYDPSVLYCSIHRYDNKEYYPRLVDSNSEHIGQGRGQGYNINIPWNAAGFGDTEYLAAFQQVILPVAYEFNPQLVLVSCGMDAAIGDPKGEFNVSPACYAHITSMLMGLADGKICFSLEGGYCLESLAEGIAMVTRTLLGDSCPLLQPQQQPHESAVESILETIANIKPFWKCLQFQGSIKDDANFSEEKPTSGSDMNPEPVSTLANMMAEIKLAVPEHRTCLVYDEKMKLHKSAFCHPECPERISRIFEKHHELGLVDRCRRLPSRYAIHKEIELCHNLDYILSIEKTKTTSFRELSKLQEDYNSIYLHQETYDSACLAVGCVLSVVDNVLGGKCVNGTAIVRPPGHHAEVDDACGFCFFNTVAIAAKYAQQFYAAKRVLIIDWDIHHGNGTQNMFVKDPSILYVSLHRYDKGFFFPGSSRGDANKVGLEKGAGFNINIPWNWSKMGDAEYLAAFQQIIMPVAYEYAPDLVLVSAGFDAALGDPLGGYSITPEGYAHFTHMLSSLANGRVIIVLEGGYNLTSISNSMARCTQTLLGDPCPILNAGRPNQDAITSIWDALQCQRPYWKCLQFQRLLPYKPSSQDNQSEDFQDSAAGGDSTTRHLMAASASDTSVDDLIQSTSEMSVSSTACPDDSFYSCSSDMPQSPEAAEIKNQSPDESLHKTQPDGSSKEVEEDLGAVGGEVKSGTVGTVKDFLGNVAGDDLQLFAVVPLTWCPHLEAVTPLPEDGLHVDEPCLECGDRKENWVCLECYKVLCGRYVECHMVKHGEESGHNMVLSYADLSVWCYGCDSYVHNQIVIPMKRAAHISKFGEDIPGY
ncbi:histone deacetylase 6-like [Anneissia japonica]|uniref:histone deacetylase 6-like n=1 Tax=Anneissia japonica TaxID=1529436 RepID=UPI0014254EBE|nr:histone deacetylase 6-like [Anneissia japonica]